MAPFIDDPLKRHLNLILHCILGIERTRHAGFFLFLSLIHISQPNFVPNEAVELELADGGTAKVRLVDCVGYMVEGAMGHMENDAVRKMCIRDRLCPNGR